MTSIIDGPTISGASSIMGDRWAPFPSPFKTVADEYRPRTIKSIFDLCQYYFLTDPLINATITKMAEYPITDILVEADDDDTAATWSSYLNDELRIPTIQKEINLDYFTYGNAFVTVQVGIRKFLVCKKCNSEYMIDSPKIDKRWKFSNLQYTLKCPNCGKNGEAFVYDKPLSSPREIRIVRINPALITILHGNGYTDNVYMMSIPNDLANAIRIGRRNVIMNIPDIFVRSLREKKQIVFDPGTLYHMKRPIASTRDYGWGMPLPYPVLDDIFYKKILRRAQEAIASRFILPLDMIFPAAGTPESSPYASVDLGQLRVDSLDELERMRKDPGYIGWFPLPMGHQSIGGTGRALMVHQELRVAVEEIISGMGVPMEFILGGLQWTGTNISIKTLANQFLALLSDQKRMLNGFLIPKISSLLGWKKVTVKQRKFKMADDLQRGMMLFQLSQAQKVSDTTLLEEIDLDPKTENARLTEERASWMTQTRETQKATAAINGEAQLIQSRFQIKANELAAVAQAKMQPPMAPPGPPQGQPMPMDPNQQQGPVEQPQSDAMGSPLNAGQAGTVGTDAQMQAQQIAAQLARMPDAERAAAISQIQTQLPTLAPLVLQFLQQFLMERQGSQQNPLTAPEPEVNPPRSEAQLSA